MVKNAHQAHANNQNSMKSVEVIHLEGNFKIRKIFTSRSSIPTDIVETGFASGNAGATAMSGGAVLRPEDVISAAMAGQRIEQIPKTFDFGPNVDRASQVLSYDAVSGFIDGLRTSNLTTDESMMITGQRMIGALGNGPSSIVGVQGSFPPQPSSIHNDPSSFNDTASND